MYAAPFEYLAPATLEEALALLSQHGEDAKLLAGGHSLIPMMKLRLAQPLVLIDLGKIAQLDYIREGEGTVDIGGMTTHYSLESSDLLRRKCPLLPAAAGHIGDVQVRNKGTIGGSLAHADPAADLPPALLAAGGRLKLAGPQGERTVTAGEFFVDLMTTALRPQEILTEIQVPTIGPRTGAAYLKVRQKASGFAIVGVAAQISTDERGACREAAVGITGVSPVPYRASRVEGMLKGRSLDDEAIREAASLAAEDREPLSDIHASSEYRRHLAQVMTRRAIQEALQSVTKR